MTDRDSESRRSDDPSLEEILASIREIVFEKDDAKAVPGAGDRKAGPEASETAPETPTAEAPADEPLHGDEGDAPETGAAPRGDGTAGERSGERGGAPQAESPQDKALPEPQGPAAGKADAADRADPAGRAAADSGEGPGDTVMILTDMIAPDGSVVRIDPSPVRAGDETPAPAEESALSAATQDELAATVRAWLDRNAPEMVDRAARRELRKLADRQE